MFKTGTIKKGNDGNMWIIAKDKNGVNRWKKYESCEDHVKFGKDGIIEEFKNSPKLIKKVGALDIKSSVVVGECSYNPDNGFTKFKKGTYFVYKLDDSLLLSKIGVDKKVRDTIWKYIGAKVAVDGGTFGFWDLDWIKALNNYDEKVASGKKFRRKTKNNIPSSINIWTKNNYNDTLFIRVKDLDEASKYIEYGFDGEKVIGVISSTGIGDGYFDCYTDKDNTMLLLLGGHTASKLYNTVKNNKQMPPHIEVAQKLTRKKTRKGSKKSSRKSSRKGSRKNNRK